MNSLLSLGALAFGVTLAGGALPLAYGPLSRQTLWRFLSLGSGLLLSVTFMEILPEALGGGRAAASWGMVAAFALLFGLEHFAVMHACQEVLEDCHVHIIGWSALFAMSLHAVLDGINLAVAFSAGPAAGWAVGGALVLHKFADGLTLSTLFRQAGYPRERAIAALGALALATPLGVLAGWGWLSASGLASSGALLGFAAGSFLYIASADVLPRLHKVNDRACLVLFIAGLLSGSGFQFLETLAGGR